MGDIRNDIDNREMITKIVEALVSENKLMAEENEYGTLDVLAISD